MRQTLYLICCILFFCLLCGFKAGADLEGSDKRSNTPLAPVFEYEETVSVSKSNHELYQQYHLLIVTSLEEASNAIIDDERWAFRMAQSAYKYVALLDNLLDDKQKGTFDVMGRDLKALTSRIKTRRLSAAQKKEIARNLKVLASDLESNYNFKKMRRWIKN